MTRPRLTAYPLRRCTTAVSAALVLSLAAALPAGALDDIRDRIREVEREQEQRAGEQEAAEDRVGGLADDLGETTSALVGATEQLERTTADVEQARVALAAAEQELADSQAEAERIDAELEVAYANEATLEESLAGNAAAQAQTRQEVGAIARESYKSGGLGTFSVTLDLLSGDGEMVDQLAMARTVMRVQDGTLERLSTQLATQVAEQDRLAGVRRDIALLLAQAEAAVLRDEQARDAAARAEDELEAREAEQSQARAALETEQAALREDLAQAEAESQALEDELASLAARKYGLQVEEKQERERIAREARERAEREARERAAAERAARERADREARERAEQAREREEQERRARERSPAPAPAPPPPSAPVPPPPAPPPAPAPEPEPPAPRTDPGGYLDHPVNAPVTSEFGWRDHPVLGSPRLHAGIDYGAACGTPVYAPAAGVVLGTPYTSGGGNKMLVDHGVHRGVNLITTYSHLQGYALRSGSVARGQLLGYVGTTGLSTGCHLHFESRENGTAVNPRNWL